MTKLTGITFTGVDEYTDLDRLQKIQEKYPYAEFGVLLSANWKENGNRYLNPERYRDLSGRNLNLSLHLCGRVAREAYRGNWEPLTDLLIQNQVLKYRVAKLFNRCQLNVASSYGLEFNSSDMTECPLHFNEVIIQQKSADNCSLFDKAVRKNDILPYANTIALLCDASGGRGVESDFVPYDNHYNDYHVGYAGGFGETNILRKLEEITACDKVGDFWVDMESSLRNADDKFDLDAVERILKMTELYF